MEVDVACMNVIAFGLGAFMKERVAVERRMRERNCVWPGCSAQERTGGGPGVNERNRLWPWRSCARARCGWMPHA